ncbi:MAG: cation:proton antiporter [Candidatus Cloacimonas sp. 4484_209]|nr:MAG: cation:proton antiporter [Candidatus Cloacimonas sp. 4484_209]
MIFYIASGLLIGIGIYGMLFKRNLIKIVIGLDFIETGVNLLIISICYVKGGTAPIFSLAKLRPSQMVDPLPQALVLTSIVIGVAVLAMALSIVVRIYEKNKTMDISKLKRLKW